YQEVTNAMIELLETDLPQWKKGWKTRPVTNIFGGVNGSTGELYKGVNRLILAKAMINSDYKYNVWMTYKQAQAKNLQVKKGAKSVRLAYY
ncbi:ArdC family protein, partial [Lactobacillus paracasei]